MPEGARWWGPYEIPAGGTRRLRIGPLHLWLEHRRLEWLVYRRADRDDPLASALEIDADPDVPPDHPDMRVDRFAAEPGDHALALQPRLADRPVVVRPGSPFHVLAGARALLFVSSPVWVEVQLPGRAAPGLTEFPAYRPSDTWLGPSTTEGEAAYAATTSGRVDLDGLPIRPHRAVTPIAIENTAPEQLAFERVAVPVRSLSLYADAAGRLWTETLQVSHRAAERGRAETAVQPGPPAQAKDAERVAGPREQAETRIAQVFDALF